MVWHPLPQESMDKWFIGSR